MSKHLIELANARFELAVRADMGGSIAHFRWHDGEAIFREAIDKDYRDARRSACFPLVPFSNRVRNRQLQFRGTCVVLDSNVPGQDIAAHGKGWQMPWMLEGADKTSVSLVHDWDGSDWPWPYQARQDIVLREQGLEIVLSLENRAVTAMPAGLGLHPYLPFGRGLRLTFDADQILQADGSGFPLASSDSTRAAEAFRRGNAPIASVTFAGGLRGGVDVAWDQPRRGLLIGASPCANCLVLYSRADEGFICVQPVTHMVGALDSDAAGPFQISVLEPGETMECRFTFSPIRQ